VIKERPGEKQEEERRRERREAEKENVCCRQDSGSNFTLRNSGNGRIKDETKL